MKKKKLAPILLLSLFISQSPSSGLVGGPFDNGQVPGSGGADGTYSAVLTGVNLIGMATFGIGSYEGFEGNGRFAVFHEGAVHYGTVSGTADLASKQVAAALLGVAGLPSETTGSSATSSSAGQTLTVRSSAEGAFIAFIKEYPMRLLFEGEGELSTTANNAVTNPPTTTTTTTTTTIMLPVNSQTNQQATQTTAVTSTSTVAPAVVRSTTPFKVRGSRTSRTAFSALNNFAAVPPLTPPSPTAGPTATPAGG